MSLAFLSPLLLWALLAVPALWLILRAVPPAPDLRRFPAVVLLLGLNDRNPQADRTPWWLLLLRALAVSAVIVGFAGPVLNPVQTANNGRPVLIVLDGGWAEAADWAQLRAAALEAVADAGRNGQTVSVIRLTDPPTAPLFASAQDWGGQLAAIEPNAWAPQGLQAWADLLPKTAFDTLWISGGVQYAGRGALLAALQSAGKTQVLESNTPVYALRPATFADGQITVTAARLQAAARAQISVTARGPDPSGIDRELARVPLLFAAGDLQGAAQITLPPELRNRIARFEIADQRSAGAVSLTDDSLKRRKVAIISGTAAAEGLQLLSQSHYLVQALQPIADILDGDLGDVLAAKPDMIVLADVAKLTQTETDALLEWVGGGGLLLRFAGPRMAANDLGQEAEGTLQTDPLLPVRLRAGGREAGGAMSWGTAKPLAPFAENSPFAGLAIGGDISVSQQVLAEPSPDLSKATLASLADGTPLVTRRAVGAGQIVLFHVTANAEWSNLPLSGLFVQMLERLAVASGGVPTEAADLAGGIWTPKQVLSGFGSLQDGASQSGVAGADLAAAILNGPSGAIPAGQYQNSARKVALNALGKDTPWAAFQWPSGTLLRGLDAPAPHQIKGLLLGFAALLLCADVLAALWVSGRLMRRGAALALGVLMLLQGAPDRAIAQQTAGETGQDQFALRATGGVVLAYVLTNDPQVDSITQAGLTGLGQRLAARTSIEPDAPLGVNLDTDDLAFFPFLYWPITPNAPLPSAAVYTKLNRFLRTGGMIMFDTRDGDFGSNLGSAPSPEGQVLQIIASRLDIPPLEPIPEDHVLTRSFYLISDFPGRATGATTWVEASAAPDTAAKGMPFRNLNDGVSPVIIGGNDWAAAWAVDAEGVAMLPVGHGAAGEMQREYAYRFGINVIMHVLTGNYKSDQVHVPALLDRLGQ